MDILLTKTTINWKDGKKSERVLDILNKDSCAGMMRVFRAALDKGASITLIPYEKEEGGHEVQG